MQYTEKPPKKDKGIWPNHIHHHRNLARPEREIPWPQERNRLAEMLRKPKSLDKDLHLPLLGTQMSKIRNDIHSWNTVGNGSGGQNVQIKDKINHRSHATTQKPYMRLP